MKKIRLGTNEDGSPLYHYEAEKGESVVFTGPITGTVDLPNGKSVDVTEPFIGVSDDKTALAVSDAIGKRHEAEGHPLFVNDPLADNNGFVHTPSES